MDIIGTPHGHVFDASRLELQARGFRYWEWYRVLPDADRIVEFGAKAYFSYYPWNPAFAGMAVTGTQTVGVSLVPLT